jgi:hypothetical protein
MEEIIVQPTATSEAESYAEHKAARAKAPEVQKPEQAEKPKTDEGVEKETEKPPADSVGEKPGKKASPAADRFKELTEARKKAEDAAEALRKENEELKAAATKPPAPKAEEPKAEATKKPADDDAADPKPKLKDFVAKLKTDEIYEDAVERHADALADWRDRRAEKTRAAAETEKQVGSVKEQFAGRIREAQAKHADFEAVTGDLAKHMSPAMGQFVMEHPEGVEVAVHLGRNRDELKAIKAMSPLIQVGMLGAIASRLKAGAGAPPEKKPVSKAPAPPPRIGGSEAPPAKDTSEAGSYEEHKRLRTHGK